MSTRLPEIVELARFQGHTAPLSGELSTQGMKRLRDAGTVAETVTVALRLIADDHGDRSLTGRVSGTIELECQRCLEPVAVALDSELELVVLDASEASHGEAESPDVLLVEGGVLPLARVVEDELLLSLPVVARHVDSAHCQPGVRHFGPPGEPEPERENPFAVLEQLKRHDDE